MISNPPVLMPKTPEVKKREFNVLLKQAVKFSIEKYQPLAKSILEQHPTYSNDDISRSICISHPEISNKMANFKQRLTDSVKSPAKERIEHNSVLEPIES